MFTIEMLDRLACPECMNFSLEVRPSLREQEEIIKGEIVCSRCHRKYPVNEGIPNMLPDELRSQRKPKEISWREWRKRLGVFKRRIKGWTEEDSQKTIAIYRELFRNFCPIKDSALEIGCGNGVVRHFLDRNVEYWGVDPDKGWILHPFLSFKGNIFPCLKEPFPFIQGVGEYLPFKDESFDSVIITATLDHVNSPSKVFNESHRVLKEKGQMLLSVGVGKGDIASGKVFSRLRRGFDRLLKGRIISLAKGIFQRIFIHIEPDLSFSMDEIFYLFRRFSDLEIKDYNNTLKFFKAKKT